MITQLLRVLSGIAMVAVVFCHLPCAEADVLTWNFAASNSKIGQVKSISDRRSADTLLNRAREAMSDSNFELAQWYVERAEKLNVDYSSKILQRFADTPAKVRADIARARGAGHAQVPSDVASLVDGPPPINPLEIPPAGNLDSTPLDAAMTAGKTRAQALLQKAQQAIAHGNSLEAVRLYHTSAALGGEFTAGEFSPVQLRAQLVAAGVSPELLAAKPATPITHAITDTITDPAELAELAQQLPDVLETPEASFVAPNGEMLSPGQVTSSSLLKRAELIQSNVLSPTAIAPTSVAQATGTVPAAPAGPPQADPYPALPRITYQGSTSLSPETMRAQQSAMQLLAEARKSMDRGELATAQQFALAAERLNVPDEAFAPGDSRPWMILADIRKRQQGQPQPASTAVAELVAPPVDTTPVMTQTPGQQQITSLPTPANVSAVVVNSDHSQQQVIHIETEQYSATPGPSPVRQVQAQQLPAAELPITEFPSIPAPTMPVAAPELTELVPPSQSVASDPPTPEPSPTTESEPGPRPLVPTPQAVAAQPTEAEPRPDHVDKAIQLFNSGQEALSEQRLADARQLFKDAWKYESELPPDVRQALQDNLQLTNEQPTHQVALNDNSTGLTEVERAALDQLLSQLSREQAAIRQLRDSEPFAAWEKLKKLQANVADADIDSSSRARLLSRVDRELVDMEQYVERNRAKLENDQRNQQILEEIKRSQQQRVRNQQQLAELAEEFNTLMDQQRYPEAVVVAKKARELDPQDPVIQTMVWRGQVARQIMSNMMRNERFEDGILRTINDVESSRIAEVGDEGLVFPDAREWSDLTDRRRKAMEANRRRLTEVEEEIHRALKKSVDVEFENQPLAYVVDQLARTAGINAFIDPEGLAAEGVTSDTAVSLSLRKPVSLKSALNLVLQPLHLSYIIQDEVLRITSEQVRDGDTNTRVYHVADLVIPIPNFVPGYNLGLPGAIREAHNVLGQGYMGGATVQRPLTMAENPGLGPASTSASVLAQMSSTNLVPSAGRKAGPYGMGTGAAGGGSQADFDTLIELITTTIDPDTWEEVGGQGTIAGFPTNLSLVVQQTQDVHNNIADLLAQLRRLQDLQVTIEVRFITLNDDFFERIGVDFDFDIDDNTGLNRTQVNDLDDDPPNITIGLDPQGMPTADLDIGFTQGSFGVTGPQFGGFDANSAANIGFAILSDIEAFFLIQAAQGDNRTNILQAPKVTLFNGQTAFVSDTSNRPFVTSLIPVVGDFAAAHQPVITVLTEGTSLTVQAVVSQDRRFVRLTLVPFFSKIGDVDTFTFEGAVNSDTGTTAVDPTDETQSVQNNAINNRLGTTVQLPTFSFTTVSTTVSVPDGGTILLGGIKRLSEGRNEQGVPILSKLPYVNRLFRNVGIGRETQSLMMMVTPRIIIQEEEEERLGLAAP